jgi:hypothetical protein
MRTNLFSLGASPEPEPPGPSSPAANVAPPPIGKTFPADEIVWGIVIRNGFDELDDPGYHRGTTQHAYLEGNDNVAICGFRPPQSGPRTRRRPRLGLPTAGEHPMCGSCARLVVAPRPRVSVPVRPARPAVAIPVAQPAPVQPAPSQAPAPAPVPAAPAPLPTVAPRMPQAAGAPPAPAPPAPAQAAPASPWVRQRTQAPQEGQPTSIELGTRHDSGLLQRGVHGQTDQD